MISTPQVFLKITNEAHEDYSEHDIQVVIVELLLHHPTNTVAALMVKKLAFSGVSRITVREIVSQEMKRIEEQFDDVVKFLEHFERNE